MAENTQVTTKEMTKEKLASSYSNALVEWIGRDIAEGRLRDFGEYDYRAEATLSMIAIANTLDRNKRSALEVCSKDSIFTAVRNLLAQRLSLAKGHAYPIVYGNELVLQRSYFGDIAVLKQLHPDWMVTASAVHKGEEFEVEVIDGMRVGRILSTSLEALDTPIVGAFSTVFDGAGNIVGAEVMTWSEIQKSWGQSKNFGSVHTNFPSEMAKRTVIRRTIKPLIKADSAGSSDIVEAYNEMEASEWRDVSHQSVVCRDATDAEARQREAIKRRSGGLSTLKEIETLKDEEAMSGESQKSIRSTSINPTNSPIEEVINE